MPQCRPSSAIRNQLVLLRLNDTCLRHTEMSVVHCPQAMKKMILEVIVVTFVEGDTCVCGLSTGIGGTCKMKLDGQGNPSVNEFYRTALFRIPSRSVTNTMFTDTCSTPRICKKPS
ncbi:uncharacterized protein BDW43DRAFT_142762 [Aspergillus alliaceus]|uniref:uncharacterized protein n=1 Tax=Petromyces alliaceus TaxID=209559 RepID=UPI0012A63267|nr:uncharacterized protein BDW43DRAFT_142762 [Aspergillus alliaceus]KAB8231232.1 hypothetical protein BDW43DRAFT_142762 [Aspergillus alliaceus]